MDRGRSVGLPVGCKVMVVIEGSNPLPPHMPVQIWLAPNNLRRQLRNVASDLDMSSWQMKVLLLKNRLACRFFIIIEKCFRPCRFESFQRQIILCRQWRTGYAGVAHWAHQTQSWVKAAGSNPDESSPNASSNLACRQRLPPGANVSTNALRV